MAGKGGAGGLGSAVAARLGRRIVAGELRPGDPVPTEAALCAALGVSRTTVREAIKRLHGKGLVAGAPRRGTRVLPAARWNQFDEDVLSWRLGAGLDAQLANQLYEIRSCFEPRACALAASRATDAQKAAIEARMQDLAAARGDLARQVAADVALHLAVFEATGNPFMLSLGAAIRTALELTFRLAQSRRGLGRAEMGMHRHVCDAIRAGDADAAERLMRVLLRASRATLAAAIEAPPG